MSNLNWWKLRVAPFLCPALRLHLPCPGHDRPGSRPYHHAMCWSRTVMLAFRAARKTGLSTIKINYLECEEKSRLILLDSFQSVGNALIFILDAVLELQSLPSMAIDENARSCKSHSMMADVPEMKVVRVFRNLRC